MKISTTPALNDMDQFGHLYSEELREAVVKHYVEKFLCQGELAMRSLVEIKAWVAGTAGATTRSEKLAILQQIRKNCAVS